MCSSDLYAPDTLLGRRRTSISEAAPTVEFSLDAMIEKEPVTVVLSKKGWIRAARGHVDMGADGCGDFKYKEGDEAAFAVHCQTTDKLLLACDDGRFFTIGADKLPSARGFGEPVRNTLDIDSAANIIAVVVHQKERQLLLASTLGKGFAAVTDELLAETRKGRQVVNLKDNARLLVVQQIAPEHDHVEIGRASCRERV